MTEQPPPQPGKITVGEAVLADFQARMELGKERYGTYLQTHNGRDAAQDKYEELLDACVYAKQDMLERADLRAEVVRLTAERDALRRLVYVLLPLMPVLSEIVSMRDAVADALAEADRIMRGE